MALRIPPISHRCFIQPKKTLTSFVDNKCLPTSANVGNRRKSFINRSPSTGNPLCIVEIPSESDISDAVRSSKIAFESWSTLSGSQRGDILYSAATKVKDNIEELTLLEALDSGVPVAQVHSGHTPAWIDTLKYYAGLASSVAGTGKMMDTPDAGGHPDSFCYTRREPLGICVGIGPWNYPLTSMLWKVAPALAAGNCILYKPSECTPLTSIRMAQLFENAGLPPGVLNVLTGDGTTGASLVRREDVDKVSFTGSTSSGIHVAKKSCDSLKKLTLELGGKSPLIIFEDADLENSVSAAIMGNFLNNGEVCSNCTRVYVHKSIKEAFLRSLLDRTEKMVIGDNMDWGTHIGPMMMPPEDEKAHFHRVMGFIDRAKADSRASLLYGGNSVTVSVNALDKTKPHSIGGSVDCRGHFIEPTIFECRSDDMEIVREEVFGPVMTVMEFDSQDEVISRANATKYGLAAGIMTNDLTRAHGVAKRLQAGNVWINNYNLSPIQMPFGPYKMSGYGKECGMEALDHYSQIKSVYVEAGDVDSTCFPI